MSIQKDGRVEAHRSANLAYAMASKGPCLKPRRRQVYSDLHNCITNTDRRTDTLLHTHTYIHKNENNLSFFFYCAIYSLFFLPPIAPMPTPYQDSFLSPKLNSPIKIILLETVSETHSQILDQA